MGWGWAFLHLFLLVFFFSYSCCCRGKKSFTYRLISCDTCSCMAGCCWVWSLSFSSCHKSSAEICNRPGRHLAYLLRRSTNSKVLLAWLIWSSATGGVFLCESETRESCNYRVSRCQVYDSAEFLLYILSKDVTLTYFTLKTFQDPQLAKTYPRFKMASWTRTDSLGVQRLCQKEDNVRWSNMDTNIGWKLLCVYVYVYVCVCIYPSI